MPSKPVLNLLIIYLIGLFNVYVEKKKWKPEIKDSWMTFFSSIVKVMKKSETKAEKESQAAGNPEDLDHKDDLRHQVGNQR